VAADAAAIEIFKRWFEAGRKPEAAPEFFDGFAAIVVYPGPTVRHYDAHLEELTIYGDFFAIGGGRDFAMGAMAAGKSAGEAVTIACQFDIGSRAPVEAFEIEGPASPSRVVPMKRKGR
jgi:hypothetical protein